MTRLCLHVLSILLVEVLSEPIPGRIPKVYNALITSNQNLEPSKAYPVYQPVLHDPFSYPYQPAIFYGGDFPLSNGLVPVPLPVSKDAKPTPPPPAANGDTPAETKAPESLPTEAPASPASSGDEADKKPTPAPPLPPNTQSPIPLNQFGLPSQVLPLGRFDPAFDGFTHIGPFTYSYPGLRFYDPYDPFSLSPYANLPPLYRPLTNVLNHSAPGPIAPPKAAVPVPSPAPADGDGATPPPEPTDLNVLNYSSKDPAIPNVPPPPLPSGGLASDKSE
ncbi:uncharacterized protein LOC126373406 [Pectinophora gossypiella]|uniref:uncharacterized protein LOC126373406 n=1 Tax=Pectinophora gossypiella TaxID=13191 RepID=UPI00214F5531|nr:uncharacterized protein LOC126373406 [Pectinophora gossypiella]